MLPPFIIEQIRKREEEAARRRDQPRLELPVDLPLGPLPTRGDNEPDDHDRGVIIVDLDSGMSFVNLG